MSVIGENIRALRELEGLTQQQLGDIVGVTRESVNKWETGLISDIRTSNLEVLLDHFSLSNDDLQSSEHGLAAQMRRRTGGFEGHIRIPLKYCDEVQDIDVPPSVLEKHPDVFATISPDASMDAVFPAKCHVVIDPSLAPASGDIVLIEPAEQTSPILRRLQLGSTKGLLSAESITMHAEDLVVGLDDLIIMGTAVWWQAPKLFR